MGISPLVWYMVTFPISEAVTQLFRLLAVQMLPFEHSYAVERINAVRDTCAMDDL